MRKINNNHGESLIEVLVALLIVSLCFLMLQGSIVSAAKVNDRTREDIEPFVKDSTKDTKVGDKLYIEFNNNSYITPVDIYQTEGGYYYYE